MNPRLSITLAVRGANRPGRAIGSIDFCSANPGLIRRRWTAATAASRFYLGADISTLPLVEKRGGIYMDGDKPGDALAIFMKNGWNCFRLRIWVDPRQGVNGLPYTRNWPGASKTRERRLMIDFHYSDWWADPQKQNKPAAWTNLDFDGLAGQLQSYTSNVIKTLKDAGATPDFVQIGNEITGGMLWPDGQVKVPCRRSRFLEAM